MQGASVLLRGTSTAMKGPADNPIVSTGEFAASVAGTVISLLLPIVAIILVVLLLVFITRRLFGCRAKRARAQAPAPGKS